MSTTAHRTRRRRRPLSQVAIGKVTVNHARPAPARAELSPLPVCYSCDRPITPNGHCGC